MWFRYPWYKEQLLKTLSENLKNEKSIRRLIGKSNFRLAGFNFQEEKIKIINESKFRAYVSGLWTDGNKEVIGTINEVITFVKKDNKWLADEIYYEDIVLGKDPEIILQNDKTKLDYQGRQRLEISLRKTKEIAKKYLGAICSRDVKKAISCLSDKAKQKLGKEGLALLTGLSNPHYCAFVIKRIKQINKDEFMFMYGIYTTYTGYAGIGVGREGVLTIRKINNNWLITHNNR
jgi:hypothetical protein